jgi:hypothetical protein
MILGREIRNGIRRIRKIEQLCVIDRVLKNDLVFTEYPNTIVPNT